MDSHLVGNFSLNSTIFTLNGTQIFLCAFLTVLVILTVLTNLFVVITVALEKSLHNFINYQYCSMALADIIVGAIAMPSLVVNTVYGHWPLNDSFCILWCISDFVGCNVSSLSLVSIAFYQYQSVKQPFDMNSRSYKIKTTLTIVLIWVVPSIYWITSIVVIIRNYKSQMDSSQCYFMYTVEYVIISDTIFYLAPAVCLVFVQILTFFALKSNTRKVGPSSRSLSVRRQTMPSVFTIKRSNRTLLNEINSVSRIVQDRKVNKKEINNFIHVNKHRSSVFLNKSAKLEKDQKAFRVLFAVATSYLILWLPWITIWPIEALCKCIPYWYYQTTYWLQYSNSLVNPLSLIIRQVTYRKKLLALFKIKIDD